MKVIFRDTNPDVITALLAIDNSLDAKVGSKRNQPIGFGELLVGQAIVISTDSGHSVTPDPIRFVVCAPTMRVPRIIQDPIDVMLASLAACCAAQKEQIRLLAFPGMGTGCGKLRPHIAAAAILNGVNMALTGKAFPLSWREAQQRHFSEIK